MGNIKESLTKKIGPLPVWAWALITAAVLYLGYRYYKSKGSSSTSSPLSAVAPSAADTTGSGAGGALSLPDISTPAVSSSYDPGFATDFTGLNPDTGFGFGIGGDGLPLQSANPIDVATPVPAGTTIISGGNLAPNNPANDPVKQIAASSVKSPGKNSVTDSYSLVPKPATKLPVTSVLQKTLPSGAKVYKTSTGALIEQAPGKSPYQIKKAGK